MRLRAQQNMFVIRRRRPNAPAARRHPEQCGPGPVRGQIPRAEPEGREAIPRRPDSRAQVPGRPSGMDHESQFEA